MSGPYAYQSLGPKPAGSDTKRLSYLRHKIRGHGGRDEVADHKHHNNPDKGLQHRDPVLPLLLTPLLLTDHGHTLAIHHRARRPRTMTMHRTLRIILTHTTQHSEASMHQTKTVAYVVPRWLARFCEWRGYWKMTHTDNQAKKSPNRDSTTDDKTRERMRQAQRHVEDIAAGRQCPVCGQSKWQTDPAHRLREFTDPGMIMPVVPALCTNCGYTLLINALIAANNN